MSRVWPRRHRQEDEWRKKYKTDAHGNTEKDGKVENEKIKKIKKDRLCIQGYPDI